MTQGVFSILLFNLLEAGISFYLFLFIDFLLNSTMLSEYTLNDLILLKLRCFIAQPKFNVSCVFVNNV